MQRVFGLLILLGAVLWCAVPAPADDGFYVVGARVAAGTRITSLPYEIKTSGYYYLTGNLSYTGGNGITVSADNVTIDLMGFVIAGPSSSSSTTSGIYMSGRKNVEVRNGTVTGWFYGIIEVDPGGAGHRIIDVRGNANVTSVWLSGNKHLIKGCTASSGSFGATNGLIVYGTGTICGCTVMNTWIGLAVGGISGSGTISDNMVLNCDNSGIGTGGPVTVSNNLVSNCNSGIWGWGGGSIISNVVYVLDGQYGITPGSSTSSPNVLDQNNVSGSGTHYDVGTSATVWGLNGGK